MSSTDVYKSHLDDLLRLTEVIRNQEQRPTPFLIVLAATYRRSYDTVVAIRKLSEDIALSSSMFILVRTLLEDVLNIEAMISGESNPESKKFLDYLHIQKYEDVKFLLSVEPENSDLQLQFAAIKHNYTLHKPKFLTKRKYVYKSWNNKMLGQIIKDLKQPDSNSLIRNEVLDYYARAYLDGNRKAHFNPSDILPYLYKSTLDEQNTNHHLEGLGLAVHLFSILSVRYADELIMQFGHKADYENISRRAKELGW